jgi:hypothetical protein
MSFYSGRGDDYEGGNCGKPHSGGDEHEGGVEPDHVSTQLDSQYRSAQRAIPPKTSFMSKLATGAVNTFAEGINMRQQSAGMGLTQGVGNVLGSMVAEKSDERMRKNAERTNLVNKLDDIDDSISDLSSKLVKARTAEAAAFLTIKNYASDNSYEQAQGMRRVDEDNTSYSNMIQKSTGRYSVSFPPAKDNLNNAIAQRADLKSKLETIQTQQKQINTRLSRLGGNDVHSTTGGNDLNAYELFVGGMVTGGMLEGESDVEGGDYTGGDLGLERSDDALKSLSDYDMDDNTPVGNFNLVSKANLNQLKKYSNSGSTKAKRHLLKSLASALNKEFNFGSSFESEEDMSKLSKMIRDKIPKPGEKGFPADAEKQAGTMRKIARVINDTYGAQIINDELEPEYLAPLLGEFVYSLAAGLHTEFLVAQENVKTVLNNMTMLRAAMEKAFQEIMERVERAEPPFEMLADEVSPFHALHKELNVEFSRQQMLLQNLLSITVDVGEEELKKLLMEAAEMHERVLSMKAKPGSNYFADSIVRLLSSIGDIGLMAAQTDRSLRNVGMTLDQYKSSDNIKDLKTRLHKLYKEKITGKSYDAVHRFVAAADIVKNSFGNQKEITKNIERLRKMDPKSGSSEFYSGGGHARRGGAAMDGQYGGKVPVERGRKFKSLLQRRILEEHRVRKLIFRAFSDELMRYLDQFNLRVDEFADRIGKDYPAGEDLNYFRDQYEKLTDIRKKNVYLALIGFKVDASSRHERGRYQANLRNFAKATTKLMANPAYSRAQAALGDIKNLVEGMNKHIDQHADMIAQKYGKYIKKYLGMGDDLAGGSVSMTESGPGGDFLGGDEGDYNGGCAAPPLMTGGNESMFSEPAYMGAADEITDGGLDGELYAGAEEGAAEDSIGGDSTDYTPTHGSADAAVGVDGAGALRPFFESSPYSVNDDLVDPTDSEVPQIDRNVRNIKETASKLRYYTYIATLHDNFARAATEMGENDTRYTEVLANAIAKKKAKLRGDRDSAITKLRAFEYFKKFVVDDDESPATPAGKANADVKNAVETQYKQIEDNIKGVYRTREDFYTVAEAIDTYLRSFSKNLAKNHDKLQSIKDMLGNHEVVAKWYDDLSGEALADLFHFFPSVPGNDYSAALRVANFGLNEGMKGTGYVDGGQVGFWDQINLKLGPASKSEHYYKRYVNATSATTNPIQLLAGNPYCVMEPHHGREVMARVINSSRNLLVLKNIVSAFSRIGELASGKTFMNDAQIYQALLDYLHASAISFGSIGHIDSVSHGLYRMSTTTRTPRSMPDPRVTTNAHPIPSSMRHPPMSSSMKYTPTPPLVFSVPPAARSPMPPATRSPMPPATRSPVPPGMSPVPPGMSPVHPARSNTPQSPPTPPPLPNNPEQSQHRNPLDAALGRRSGGGDNSIMDASNTDTYYDDNASLARRTYLRSEYGLYMSSVLNGLKGNYTEEDELWVMIIKAMATKVLSVVGVNSMMTRPHGTLPGFTPLRMITGGDEYSYGSNPRPEDGALDLYFYMPLLLEFYRTLFRPDADMTDTADGLNKRISMLPDVDGTFSAVIWLMFTQLSATDDGGYSDIEVRALMSEINQLYAKYRAKGGNVTKAVVNDLVSEINRRYGIITQDDHVAYKKYKEMVQRGNAGNYGGEPMRRDFEILKHEGTEDASIIPPSDKYLTTDVIRDNNSRNLVLHSQTPYEISDSNRKILNKFRSQLDGLLGSPGNTEREKWMHSQYKDMLRNCHDEFTQAKDDDSRYQVASKLIRGNDAVTHSDHMRYVMFHETVCVNLSTLGGIYNLLDALRTKVKEYSKLRNISTVYLTMNMFEDILTLCGEQQHLVDFKIQEDGHLHIEFGPLYDEIRNLMSSTRAHLDFFRGYFPSSFTDKYERADIAGTYYSLEEELVNKMFVETNEDANEIISMNDVNKEISNLFMGFVALNNDKDNIGLMRSLCYYHSSFDNSGVGDATARYQSESSATSKFMSGSGSHRTLRFEQLYDFTSTLSNVPKSLMFAFNEAVAKYIGSSYDKTTKKAYGDMLREPAETVLNRAISNGESYPDTIIALFGHVRWLATMARYSSTSPGFSPSGTNNINPNGEERSNKYMDRLKALLNEAGFVMLPGSNGEAVFVDNLMTNDVKNPAFSDHFSEDKLVSMFGSIYSGDGYNEAGVKRAYVDLIFTRTGKVSDTEVNNRFNSTIVREYMTKSGKTEFLNSDRSAFDFSSQEKAERQFKRMIGALKKYAPEDPGDSLPPSSAITANWTLNFGKRYDPHEGGFLYSSLAGALKTLLNERTKDSDGNATDKYAYLINDYVDLSLSHKEALLVNLPLHHKIFSQLALKAAALEKIVRNKKFNAHLNHSGLVYPAGMMQPQKDIHPGRLRKFTDEHLGDYFMTFISNIKEACSKFAAHISVIMRKIGDTPVFGESRRDSLTQYRSEYNKEPITPFSNLTMVLAPHGYNNEEIMGSGSKLHNSEFDFMPFFTPESAIFRYQYSVRHILGRSDVALQKEHLAQAFKLVAKFNSMSKSHTKLPEEECVKSAISATKLLRFINDVRNFKAHFVTTRTFIRDGADDSTDGAKVVNYSDGNAVIHNPAMLFARMYIINSTAAVKFEHTWQLSRNTDSPSARFHPRFDKVLRITSDSDQLETLKRLSMVTKPGSSFNLSTKRKDMRVYSIIDLNIIPLNLNMISRDIPLANLYNWSYTFDRIACELFELDGTQYTNMAARGDGPGNYDTKQLFVHMLMQPFVNLSDTEYDGSMHRIFVGSMEGELGRPKYISDQIYNKSLWGEVIGSDVNPLGPAADNKAYEITTTDPKMFTHIRGDPKQPGKSRDIYTKVLSSTAKQDLRDLGFARFNTRHVRKLIFLTNVHRVLRLKLGQELMHHTDVVVKGDPIVDPHTTEYFGHEGFQSRYSHRYGDKKKLSYVEPWNDEGERTT